MAIRLDHRDYDVRDSLSSLDFVLLDVMTVSAGAGATVAFPKAIKSKTAAVIIVAQGAVNVMLQSDASAIFAQAQSIAVPAGVVGPIGLELDNDITPAVNNAGAAAVLVTIIMLRRRRVLAFLPGMA